MQAVALDPSGKLRAGCRQRATDGDEDRVVVADLAYSRFER